MNAKQQGFDDARKGLRDCPYTDYERAIAWEAGWQEAVEGGWCADIHFNDGE